MKTPNTEPEVNHNQWKCVNCWHNVDENVGEITACIVSIADLNDGFAWFITFAYILCGFHLIECTFKIQL